jgi:iron complex outermembrane receptor protein
MRQKSMNFVKLALATTALSGPLLPTAWAQESTDADGAERDSSIENIVVTVERREQTLQDYAGTASVITGAELKALGLQNINDLDGRIPGLSISNNQGNLEVYIRGVGSSNNTELGDPAAATHLNDVYIPRPSGLGGANLDIARVEVNIGPQGTLRGRNATAGSVNLVPWQPGIGVLEAVAEASYGNYNDWRIEGVLNIPVTENSAFRFAAFKSQRDSYLTNVTPCSGDIPGVDVPTCEDEGVGVAEAADDFSMRAAYKIELTDRFSATLTGDLTTQNGSGYTGINFARPLGDGIRPEDIENPRDVVGRAFTPEEDTSHWGIKAHLQYDGDGFNVEYIGSYRDLLYDYQFVTPATPFYPGIFDFDNSIEGSNPLGAGDIDNFSRVAFLTDSKSQVHELRATSEDDARLVWSVGAFLFKEDQRTFLGTTGDRNAFFSGVEFNQDTTTDSYSFYGDVTYEVTDRFRVTAGLRYTNDTKERFGVNAQYQFVVGGTNFAQFGLLGVGQGTEGFEFAGLGRTIFNPDADGNDELSDDEVLAFFFDGVETFGARDGLDDIFANGIIPGDAPAEGRPACADFASTDDCANTFVPELNGLVSFAVLGGNSIALQNGRLDNDFIDWRLRAEYDLTDDNLLYALVSTGNKSGGFNDNIAGTEGISQANIVTSAPAAFAGVNTVAPTYGPETLTLFEIGSKNEFDINGYGAKINISAFYYDYADLQLTTLLSAAQALDFTGLVVDPDTEANLGGNVVAFTFNAASAEIYGMQLETSFELPWNVNFNSTLLWMPGAKVTESIEIQDARFQADVDPVNAVNRSIQGNRLPRTPRIQFNGNITKGWELDSGTIDGVFSFGYRAKVNMTIFNGIDYETPDDPSLRLNDTVPGYWTLDAGLGYTHGEEGRYRIEAYVANLTNAQQAQGLIITQFDNTRFLNRPRIYGVRARAKF